MKHRAKLKLNNKGSGIITVMVAIIFLTAFGSVLLMLSYTGYEMRLSDRKGKENLYDASAIMEEINTGIQNVCSEAIVDSYSKTLVHNQALAQADSSDETKTALTVEFNENYLDYLTKWKDSNGHNLFDKSTGTWKLEALEAMVLEDRGGTYKIENVSEPGHEFEVTGLDGKDDTIVLKGVSVTYTKSGRTTKVTTDIEIGFPPIDVPETSQSESGINSNACIVRGKLIQEASQGDSAIYGSAYFGSVELTGGSSTLTLKGEGTFISPGDVNVAGIPSAGDRSINRFTVASDSKLWAKNINVAATGSASLEGDTYVANDLVLNGLGTNAARVTIKGTYFGFGNSNTRSSESSSIIVNGKGCYLDVSELKTLTLAGFDFIGSEPDTATSNGNNVQMGESASVRSNQKAYLVPVGYLDVTYNQMTRKIATNPEVMTTTEFAHIRDKDLDAGDGFAIDTTTPLWTGADGETKTFASYGASLQMVTKVVSENTVVYFFVKFDTDEHANEYFRDYLKNNASEIDRYISNYVTVNGKASGNTVGNSYMLSGGGEVNFSRYLSNADATAVHDSASVYAQNYENLKTSLGTVSADAEQPDDPVALIINDSLETLGTKGAEESVKKYTNADGDLVAVAVNGDYTIDKNTPSTLCLVIATGNVTVDGQPASGSTPLSFNGLIVCEGDLTLKNGAQLNKNPTSVVKAYSATTTAESGGGNITEYVTTANENSDSYDSGWTVTGLVTYSNWSRSSED